MILFIPLLTLFLALGAKADRAKLGQALSGQLETAAIARGGQVVVDHIDDKTQELLREYRLTLKKIESTKIYNQQLLKLLQNQEEEKVSLREQTEQVNVTSQEIVPLMLTMVSTFDELVKTDAPFLKEERRKRSEELQALMGRADVTTSEKFRRIMEAYQIENEYGRTLEAYRGVLTKNDQPVTVDFLRVGRLSLVYQTLDGKEQGVWDHAAKKWVDLEGEYRRPLRDALRVARKQAAPNILTIPLVLAEMK
jgi:hypothetical protein